MDRAPAGKGVRTVHCVPLWSGPTPDPRVLTMIFCCYRALRLPLKPRSLNSEAGAARCPRSTVYRLFHRGEELLSLAHNEPGEALLDGRRDPAADCTAACCDHRSALWW